MAGERVCRAAVCWYPLTGCDAVSQFLERGKPIAWKTSEAFPELTDTFIKLSKLEQISTEDLTMIEHFIILLYDGTCSYNIIGKCCKYLFM